MTAAIEFIQAEKVYDTKGNRVHALKPLNLTIKKGEFFGLLGHNGAGKTTSINLLAGITDLTSGHIRINGLDIKEHTATCKRLLGIVPQEIYADSFFPLMTMLRIQSKLSGVQPDKEWIDFLLNQLALTQHTKKTSRELSGGMKRRMMIARALVHKPQIVVLDEPTAGVDVELRHSMWEFVNALHGLGLTIILTTHYLEEAEKFCQRLAILKQGELITLKTNRELLSLGNSPKLKVAVSSELFNPEWESELAALQIESQRNGEDLELLVDYDDSDSSTFLAASQKIYEFLNSHQLKILRIETERPNLENVFLKLTR